MKRYRLMLSIAYLCLSLAAAGRAQSQLSSTAAASSTASIPPLVRFSGNVKDDAGHPRSGVVGITFALYKDEQGGAPLWLETQNVQADSKGNYTVLLGSTNTDGLPTDIFVSNEARWLGVQVEGQEEQPRKLLVSAPYALKAGDAETLGGKPLSAFQLVEPQGQSKSSSASGTTPATEQPNEIRCSGSAGCNTGFLPEFASNGGSATVSNSIITQTGAGAAAKIGLGTTSPGARLDVLGSDSSAPAAGAQVSTPTFPQYLLNATRGGPNAKIWRMIGRGTNDFEIQTLNDLYGGEVTAMEILRNGTSITSVDFPNGSVGIGTTNPLAGLDVRWNSSFGGAILAKIQTANSDAGAVTGITQGNIVGAAGVVGAATDTGAGVTYGILGQNANTGQFGAGVYGWSTATSGPTRGTVGEADSPNGTGVWGFAVGPSKTGSGIGCCPVGVWGDTSSNAGGAAGLVGTADDGRAIYLENNSPSGVPTAFIKQDASGVPALVTIGDTNITGNLTVTGNVSKGSGSFKIDHPLDPANKYLYHSFVESPDMMNVYNGNVTTNKRGVAVVVMPDYFEALNRDFRYQLTPIGRFAQAIVAMEVSHGRFMIKTSRPGVKVSWQVTGIRHDAYADAHRIQVEEKKPLQERGKYLHPELFGAPQEKAVGYSAPPPTETVPTRVASTVSTPSANAN